MVDLVRRVTGGASNGPMSSVMRSLRAAGRRSGLPLEVSRNPLYATFLDRAYMRFDPVTKQPASITMRINPVWNERRSTELTAFAKKRGIDDLPLAMATAVLQHEVAHRDVCPIDVDLGQVMTDAVIAVLAAADKFTDEMAHYVSNLIADLIVNRALDRSEPAFASGLMMLYYDHPDKRGLLQGKLFHYLFRADRIRAERSYQGLFGVFIGTLLAFFDDPDIDTLFAPILANAAPEEAAVAAIVALFDETDTTQPDTWRALCLKVTRILLPFIEPEDAIPLVNPSGYFDHVDYEMPEAEIGFEEWMFEVGALYPERHSFYVTGAARIDFTSINDERPHPGTDHHLPVFFEPDFSIDPTDDAGTPAIPDNVLILVDASPSMGYGARDPGAPLGPDDPMPGTGHTALLPWGDRSRYHAAALFTYGVLRYLSESPPRTSVQARVATFAGNVRATPWFAPPTYPRHVPQVLLDRLSPFTRLDSDRLSSLVGGRSNVLLFIVTDGDLPSTAHAASVASYLEHRGRGLSFHLISVLEKGRLHEALEALPNGQAHFVEKIEDIHRLGLRLLVDALPPEHDASEGPP